MEEQNPRLKTGLSAVYPREDGRSSFLAADPWTDAYFSLYVNAFHARHVRERIVDLMMKIRIGISALITTFMS